MTQLARRSKPVLAALAVGACLAVAPQSALADHLHVDAGDTASVATRGGRAGAEQSTAQSSLTIHVDPQTGRAVRAPAGVPLQLAPSLQNAMSTSHQDLVETPSPVPGGGVLVHTRGRFRHPLVGTIDDQGTLTIRHLHPAPDAPDHR
jgi:hypothetical protein